MHEREADAGERAVGGLAAAHTEQAAQFARQRAAAEHAVGDVVAPQEVVAPDRAQVEEAIEARHALDDGRRQADTRCDARDQRARQPAGLGLDLAQDLHQGLAARSVATQRGVDRVGAVRLGGGRLDDGHALFDAIDAGAP